MPPFDPSRVARFLAEAGGADNVEIGPLTLLAGGAIQQNWGFRARFIGGPVAGERDLVLRTDAATGVPSSLSRIEEFAVLRAAFAAGVRVAEPLFACADSSVIGKPFFVMRRVPGTAQGRQITSDAALEPQLTQIADRLGRELARLQTIRPPRADLDFLRAIGPREHIAAFRAYLDDYPQPRPVLEWAISWLETHMPEPLPPVLCHRDFRTGNYLIAPTPPSPASGGGPFHVPAPASGGGFFSVPSAAGGGGSFAVPAPAGGGGSFSVPSPASGGGSGWGHGSAEVTAILDWEFAGWGDPDEDIGWFCCKGWRFARLDREAGGIAARAPFYDGYEAASGRRPDPERVFFWEVLANVRWAAIALQQSDRHLVGGARDLSTAIIGRRATECDLEFLMLLDRDGPPKTSPAPPRGERVGVRGRPAVERRIPSPSQPCGLGPSLSRNAGEGQAIRDLPSGAGLLQLGRELLIEELLPLLPPERERELRLVATAMGIAAREAAAGEAPAREIAAMLAAFYGEVEEGSWAAHPHPNPPPPAGEGVSVSPPPPAREGVSDSPSPPAGEGVLDSPPPQAGEGWVGVSAPARPLAALLRHFAADLRTGAFEACEARGRAARAILWRMVLLKLREGNPDFLAANGFGE